MADAAKRLPARTEEKAVAQDRFWSPFVSLRSEIDRLFEDFAPSAWGSPERSLFGRSMPALNGWSAAPAVDVVEKDDAFEISAELAGMDQKDIDVTLSDGFLTIRGEKQEEKEEKRKEYHVSERRYGSFQRSFQVPDGVDANKVEASFQKGILKIKLPKTVQAEKKERKLEIKAS